MSNKREALEAALSALESERIMAADSAGNYTIEITPKRITEAIAKVKAALTEPEQEPVAWEGGEEWESLAWQPIETAPIKPFDKEHWYKAHSKTLLLGYANNSRIYMGSYHFTEKGKGRFLDHQGYVAKPTHWMPLPPPPKE